MKDDSEQSFQGFKLTDTCGDTVTHVLDERWPSTMYALCQTGVSAEAAIVFVPFSGITCPECKEFVTELFRL